MDKKVTLEDIHNSLRTYPTAQEQYKFKADILLKETKLQETVVIPMKIFSRTYKGKIAEIDNLVLVFNEDGFCETDAGNKELVEVLMAHRPGHFEFVAETVSAPVVVEEAVAESDVSDESVATEDESAPTKRGRKKA